MQTKSFYLKSFHLADGLTESELNDLMLYTHQKEVKKNQVVYAKGADKKVLMLVSGKVKITEVNMDGDEIIKEILGPGDLFGDLVHQAQGNAEFAEVISERAIYFLIEQDNLWRMMSRCPQLMANYMEKINQKYRRLESRFINMVTKDVKSRLLYCFREWAIKEGKQMGDKVVVKNSLTHMELANLISTSRQTVTVILNELKEEGVLNYNRRELEFSPLMLAS